MSLPQVGPPAGTTASAPDALARCLLIARTELRMEARVGEVWLLGAALGGVTLLVMPLAVGTDVPLLRRIGPGLYWVVVLLFGVTAALRPGAVPGPAQRALLRLACPDPLLRTLGRVAANAALLTGFGVLLLPPAWVLYDPDTAGWVTGLALLPLVAGGLALLSGLAGLVAGGLPVRQGVAPLLAVPLALPLLLAGTQAGQAAAYGRSALPWAVLALAVDTVLLLVLVLASRHLEEWA